jgi:type II secretory pathway component PulF
MAKFSYQAISENGTNVSGTLEADSIEMAQNALLAKGYIPTKVSATTKNSGEHGQCEDF